MSYQPSSPSASPAKQTDLALSPAEAREILREIIVELNLESNFFEIHDGLRRIIEWTLDHQHEGRELLRIRRTPTSEIELGSAYHQALTTFCSFLSQFSQEIKLGLAETESVAAAIVQTICTEHGIGTTSSAPGSGLRDIMIMALLRQPEGKEALRLW